MARVLPMSFRSSGASPLGRYARNSRIRDVFHSLKTCCGAAALLLLGAGTATAEPALELSTRAWYADNGQDEALVWGPELAGPLTEAWILRARYQLGTFNAGGDTEEVRELRLTAGARWGALEAGAGYARLAHDTELQPGWAWSYETEQAERNADIHGPLLYARAAGRFGATPLGWQVLGAWLVKDYGDLDDLGFDGSHVDLEAAATYERKVIRAGIGYRYIRFRDVPARVVNQARIDRDTLEGAFAFLSFLF